MPTRWSATLIPTARQAPSDAVVPSHQLLLRAGYIQPLAAGAYSYLPLGKRSLDKAIAIVKRHMDPIAAEVLMPSLQPIDLWERTQRRAAYGDNLFVVTDRHGREAALGPTHEEVITTLVGGFIKSYRDLPKSLYQVQTKFRDEFRPRFGLLRTREFQMKDAYSFHLPHAVAGQSEAAGPPDTPGTLSHTYEQFRAAYHAVFRDCGVPAMEVEAEAGPIGGDASHEFMCPTPTGEDTILVSDRGNYAANVEKCATGEREVGPAFDAAADPPAPVAELEKVHTPDIQSIDDLCAFWKKSQGSKLKPQNTLKTLLFASERQRCVMAVVRGDREVNEAKLAKAVGCGVALGDEAESREAGFAVGFVGPQRAADKDWIDVVIDPEATATTFWVAGANEVDHHVKGFDWQRDFVEPMGEAFAERVVVADIRDAVAGDPSPKGDGGVLEERRGIELGHIFKLGEKYTKGLGVTVAGEDNQPVHPLMGCYGIGVNRILAAAIEREGGHDEAGIVWPVALAPYHVVITPIKPEGAMRETADRLAEALEGRRVGRTPIEVLIDDRDERPGPKFKDADLIGIPVRVTVGDKGLSAAEPFVEVKARDGSNGPRGEAVPVDRAVDRVVALLGELG
jgi:prolyl-tRNA synthetase